MEVPPSSQERYQIAAAGPTGSYLHDSAAFYPLDSGDLSRYLLALP
jgi:hypothetical protein